ncbi:hypothetical protein V7S43_009789 [Phytophthora oleae]|uniref:RxLR effector protein n=1 Tax=Phytophthora oleae TaxID=2107226 RepID=A0ABD3FDZ8_9STRA
MKLSQVVIIVVVFFVAQANASPNVRMEYRSFLPPANTPSPGQAYVPRCRSDSRDCRRLEDSPVENSA